MFLMERVEVKMKPLESLQYFVVSLFHCFWRITMKKHHNKLRTGAIEGNPISKIRIPQAGFDQITKKVEEVPLVTYKKKTNIPPTVSSSTQRIKLRFNREELIAGITPENLHEAVDYGDPVGEELL